MWSSILLISALLKNEKQNHKNVRDFLFKLTSSFKDIIWCDIWIRILKVHFFKVFFLRKYDIILWMRVGYVNKSHIHVAWRTFIIRYYIRFLHDLILVNLSPTYPCIWPNLSPKMLSNSLYMYSCIFYFSFFVRINW